MKEEETKAQSEPALPVKLDPNVIRFGNWYVFIMFIVGIVVFIPIIIEQR